jgi:hypothetical protein
MAPRKTGAGGLRTRIDFQSKGPSEDEFGNPLPGGPYATVFSDNAEIVPRMGSEAVLAARLQGLQPVTIRVRSNTNTRSLDATYRAVDARTGAVYAITSPPVNTDQKNQYIEMLATSGTQTDA